MAFSEINGILLSSFDLALNFLYLCLSDKVVVRFVSYGYRAVLAGVPYVLCVNKSCLTEYLVL